MAETEEEEDLLLEQHRAFVPGDDREAAEHLERVHLSPRIVLREPRPDHVPHDVLLRVGEDGPDDFLQFLAM